MSLVGTRPPTVDEWDKYELHHRARLATKPGLTGMWQVSGRSNITDLADRVHYFKEDEKGVAIMCKAMRLILISELTDLKRQMNRGTEWKSQKSSLELFIKMTV